MTDILQLREAGKIGKLTLQAHSQEIIKSVLDGNIEAWKAVAYCRYLKDLADEIRKGVMDAAISEVKEPFSYQGVSLKVKEAGMKYDYESSNHPEYNRLAQEVRSAQVKMKELEKLLASLKEPLEILDSSTGELITIYPPKKSSTTTLEVSYNKPIEGYEND